MIDEGHLEVLAHAWESKYRGDWRFEVHDGAFHHEAVRRWYSKSSRSRSSRSQRATSRRPASRSHPTDRPGGVRKEFPMNVAVDHLVVGSADLDTRHRAGSQIGSASRRSSAVCTTDSEPATRCSVSAISISRFSRSDPEQPDDLVAHQRAGQHAARRPSC